MNRLEYEERYLTAIKKLVNKFFYYCEIDEKLIQNYDVNYRAVASIVYQALFKKMYYNKEHNEKIWKETVKYIFEVYSENYSLNTIYFDRAFLNEYTLLMYEIDSYFTPNNIKFKVIDLIESEIKSILVEFTETTKTKLEVCK